MKFLTQDYYEILDVAPGADNEAVKRAYRLVRRSFRPDSMAIHSLYSAEETEAIGAKIDEAFHILSRPESAGRYAKYHRTGREGMSIPRRPKDFFDQVHQLDAATPIEALARAVGAEEEVTDAPIAAVAQLHPRPPRRPIEIHAQGPQLSHPPDGRRDDTDPDAHAAASAAGAVPESHIDLFLDALEEVEDAPDAPVFLTASVVLDPERPGVADPMDRGPAAGPTPVDSIHDLPEEAFETSAPPAVADLDYSDVDALLSSASGMMNAPVSRSPVATSAPPYSPPAPRRAAQPRTWAQSRTEAPSRSSAPGFNPSGGQASTPPSVASPTAPTLAVPPVEGPSPGTNSTLASVAAVRRDFGPRPRRWSRDTIRTRAVGPLQFEPLAATDLEAFEMDCGGMGGEFIKQVRRAVGVSIEDIATRTKISTGMLRYIEAEDLQFLPARVYLRGYLTQIGRLLKLPVPKIVDGFMKANGLGKK
jgi:hypothetical protein